MNITGGLIVRPYVGENYSSPDSPILAGYGSWTLEEQTQMPGAIQGFYVSGQSYTYKAAAVFNASKNWTDNKKNKKIDSLYQL